MSVLSGARAEDPDAWGRPRPRRAGRWLLASAQIVTVFMVGARAWERAQPGAGGGSRSMILLSWMLSLPL